MKLLLESGADPEAVTGNGDSMVTLAARWSEVVAVMALIGAGVERPDQDT